MPDPAPAPLTDEQIEEFREDLAFTYEGEYDPQSRREAFDAWLSSVVTRAKWEERRRLWKAIDLLMDGVTDQQVIARFGDVDSSISRAYRLGVATALMECAKEATNATD